MIEMEITGLKETNQKISMMKKIIPNSATKGLFDVAVAIRNTALISMQNTVKKSGTTYKRGVKSHRPSAPGWPPAIDTGNLTGSIVPEILPSQQVRVGSRIKDPGYPEFLELGTYKMDPRPWMEPSIETVGDDIEDEVMDNIIIGIERL